MLSTNFSRLLVVFWWYSVNSFLFVSMTSFLNFFPELSTVRIALSSIQKLGVMNLEQAAKISRPIPTNSLIKPVDGMYWAKLISTGNSPRFSAHSTGVRDANFVIMPRISPFGDQLTPSIFLSGKSKMYLT